MLFGDRDASATDETMTCLAPERIEADLAGFEIEHWHAKEETRRPRWRAALFAPHRVRRPQGR